ncbi:PREDICTED: uncharacterized protein LOC101302057 [Fragaria vesca subsp. vesca]
MMVLNLEGCKDLSSVAGVECWVTISRLVIGTFHLRKKQLTLARRENSTMVRHRHRHWDRLLRQRVPKIRQRQNELRAKAAKNAEDAKEKKVAQRAAARATSKPAPRGRPPKAAANSGKVASSKAKDFAPQASQASSRTSVRIRDNAKNSRK